MGRMIGLGHQDRDVLSQYLRCFELENLLGGRIEIKNGTGFIDDDHGVDAVIHK